MNNNYEYLNNKEKINKILNEYKNKNEYIIKLTINGKPENYVRERSGRGKHFYNPKSSKSEAFKKEALHLLSKEEYNFTRELIKNKEANYYIHINAEFYIPT